MHKMFFSLNLANKGETEGREEAQSHFLTKVPLVSEAGQALLKNGHAEYPCKPTKISSLHDSMLFLSERSRNDVKF